MKNHPTIKQLLEWACATQSSVIIHADATAYTQTGEDAPVARDLAGLEWLAGHAVAKEARGVLLSAAGYDTLAAIFGEAFDQAARGKGAERHANGEPFDAQVMADMARRFGRGALLGQAFKKSEESQRLPYPRARAELLGAMVYLAGAVLDLDRVNRTAANDNSATATVNA